MSTQLTKEVLDALERRYPAPRWAFFRELRVGTGYGMQGYNLEQSMDAWAMNLYPSEGWKRIAFEVKTSRSDFWREKSKPEKRATAIRLSNEFYFVTPTGLLFDGELPEDCGLIEVGYEAKISVKAPWREAESPPIPFVASLARRISRQERANDSTTLPETDNREN